ncbi:retinoschisin-like [Patiria miniata]|uniref:F5/8 type C domain-containing protein n=1 Tax=Patiria miniata TaxID=46514 RepID=A0A914AF76_PATMI|nr:retinoschisin-like [Patiria miniata]
MAGVAAGYDVMLFSSLRSEAAGASWGGFVCPLIYHQPDGFWIIAFVTMDGAVAWILMASALTVLASCHKVCFIGSEYNPQAGIPPRWFLPYKDPCECTAIRLGGMQMPASSYRQGAPHYLKELFLSEDSDEIQAYFKCSRTTTASGTTSAGGATSAPLGMKDGTIPDDHITASSFIDASCCTPQKGRLNSGGVWKPSSNEGSWIEVDLATSTVVSGVITKSLTNSRYPGYVTKYKVAFGNQSTSNSTYVTDANGNAKVFKGNTDHDTPVTNLFDESVVATVVRIEPTEWHTRVRLQLELLGCRLD